MPHTLPSCARSTRLMRSRRSLASLLAACVLAPLSTGALAAWPDDKPIEVVVGFAAGGETDIMARGLAPFIRKHLGGNANLVVINKIGAAGEIGNGYVQRAAPDGYTIGVVNVPPLLFVPLTKKAQYDPKELALVARVVSDPTLLVTRASSPYTSLKQIVQALQAKPGSLSFGYNGVGSNGHLAMLKFQLATGVQLNDIPFNGSSQSKNALLGGHTDFMFTSLTAVPAPDKELVPLRVVSQFMEQRAPALQQVNTARGEGIDVVMPSDRGFAVQRKVPAEIRARLEKAIAESLRDPEFLQTASSYASVISYLPGAAWQQILDASAADLQALAKKMPAQP
jgi:tripartite-type tricarboxylate transporter receptor subunit TctC